jgi:hypothetical protein
LVGFGSGRGFELRRCKVFPEGFVFHSFSDRLCNGSHCRLAGCIQILSAGRLPGSVFLPRRGSLLVSGPLRYKEECGKVGVRNSGISIFYPIGSSSHWFGKEFLKTSVFKDPRT